MTALITKGSYFEECERDPHTGYCKPRGGGGEGGSSEPSKSVIEFERGSDEKSVSVAMKKLIGENADPEDAAALVGLPRGAKVALGASRSDGSLRIDAEHPDLAGRFVSIVNKGRIYISLIVVSASAQGRGVGTAVFSNMVDKARQLGLKTIECHAAGSAAEKDSGYNGYYTWPRLGFDEPLKQVFGKVEMDQVQREFPGAETVLDVMEREGGAQWWKENGRDMYGATFDLSDGSRSMRVLEAYRKERAAREKGWGRPTSRSTKKRSRPSTGPGRSSRKGSDMTPTLVNKLHVRKHLKQDRPKTLGIDFDGRIAKKVGTLDLDRIPPREGAREALELFRRKGIWLIVWTARDDLDSVKAWMQLHEIPVDEMNSNKHQPCTATFQIRPEDKDVLLSEVKQLGCAVKGR